jgi:hypothetical protein
MLDLRTRAKANLLDAMVLLSLEREYEFWIQKLRAMWSLLESSSKFVARESV